MSSETVATTSSPLVVQGTGSSRKSFLVTKDAEAYLMKRILSTVCVIALIFGSLITFPEHLPWLVLIWIILSVLAFGSKKPMWPWLIVCILIVTIKRPGFTYEFWILSTVFVFIAYLDWRTIRRRSDNLNVKRLAGFGLALLLATTVYGTSRWSASNTWQQFVLDDRPIACLGDSLTDYGYPQELEKLISVPVVDFGVSGITTDDGIEMIQSILAADPQLVIIELGGHDYNSDKKTRTATRRNFVELIESFLNQNVAVVLVEIPRGFISDPYNGLERELANQYDLQLISDSLIRNFIFNSPILPPGMWHDTSKHLSNDGLHPNALGNQRFARTVTESLVRIYGDRILASELTR